MRFVYLLIVLLIVSDVSGQFLNPVVDSIPTRDGKKLAADIYLPNTTGSFPVILVQTPYNRLRFRTTGLPLIRYQIQNSNYAFVTIDWRCFYGSSGACTLQPSTQPGTGEDGFDVITWITAQSWSNGRVGTWGPSALGRVQYLTAKEHPPGLVCVVPLVAGSQYNYQEYFPGGVARTEYIEQLDDLGFGLSTKLYNNPVYNTTWSYAEDGTYYPEMIEIPMLMIGGWYDHNVTVMLELFKGLKSESPAKDQHRLLMGPWAHGGNSLAYVGSANQGELSYPGAAGWSDSLALVFFDYHLRQVANGWESSPNIQYFQMGENKWEQTSTWPPFRQIETLFLHAGGELNYEKPDNSTGSSELVYDPRDPSPTHGGPTLRQDQMQGPYDQRQIVESRNDNLIFTTSTFTNPIRITGTPQLKLYVSSDRLDTDFAIRLTDVYPDNRSMLLSDGIFRMRFRDGFTANDTSTMALDSIYRVTIDLPELANTFLPGHRLRLIVTSSNYPRFDKNLNNGGPMYVAGDTLVATNTVYHNAVYSSSFSFQTDMINATSSIIESKKTLDVFPNPFSDQLFISNIHPGPVDINVFDCQGKRIASHNQVKEFDLFSLKLDVEKSGLYILQVICEDGTFTQKVIRNK